MGTLDACGGAPSKWRQPEWFMEAATEVTMVTQSRWRTHPTTLDALRRDRVEVPKCLLGTGWAKGSIAREACEPARHEIAHVAAHQLSAPSTGCRHVGSVVHRDTLLFGKSSRTGEQRSVGADESTIVSYGGHTLAQAVRCRKIAPRAHRHVGHLVEGEIQGGERLGASEQLAGVGVVLVVWVLACQDDARIDEPDGQRPGRAFLISSATPPPWPTRGVS